MPLETHFIDAHCHLADPIIQSNLANWIKNAEAAKIFGWIQGGIDPMDWDRQLDLAQKYPAKIYPCFGLHPWTASKMALPEIEQILLELKGRMPKAYGFGELGLDFGPQYIKGIVSQLAAFEGQLKLAREFNKPLVLHGVDAHPKTLELLEKYGPHPYSGIVHSFNGPIEIAQQYTALGFKVSIGPQILRPGYLKLKKAIPLLSMDELVVETDAPDRDLKGLLLLHEVARSVATLKGIETERVLSSSTENLKTLFGI